jgi:hypothetical protein
MSLTYISINNYVNEYSEYNKIWESYSKCKPINEEWDEIDQDDKARSTAGLSSFSSTHEDEGWPADEIIKFHGQSVIQAAAEYLETDLLNPKVNSLQDIHPDARDGIPGEVIDKLQKLGELPKRLDWNEHADERDEIKDAITSFLTDRFDEIVDAADQISVDRGDRPPLDSGIDEYPHMAGGPDVEGITSVPAGEALPPVAPEANPYGEMDPSDPLYPQIKRSPEEFGESNTVDEDCGCGLPVLQKTERSPIISRILDLLRGNHHEHEEDEHAQFGQPAMMPKPQGIIKITKISG